MSYSVYISPGVYRSLRKQSLYYEKKRGKYGLKFLSRFDEAVILLQENPYAFQIRHLKYRIIQLHPFQDILVFSIHGQDVNISRLIHAKQQPRKRYR